MASEAGTAIDKKLEEKKVGQKFDRISENARCVLTDALAATSVARQRCGVMSL